jgi:hypothetical protein
LWFAWNAFACIWCASGQHEHGMLLLQLGSAMIVTMHAGARFLCSPGRNHHQTSSRRLIRMFHFPHTPYSACSACSHAMA